MIQAEWASGSHIKAASENILRLREDHVVMCKEAYAYSKAASAEQHEDLCDTLREYNKAHRARHYIGRLSSWRKAARNVVSLGASFPAILARYERWQPSPTPEPSVRLVGLPSTISMLCWLVLCLSIVVTRSPLSSRGSSKMLLDRWEILKIGDSMLSHMPRPSTHMTVSAYCT